MKGRDTMIIRSYFTKKMEDSYAAYLSKEEFNVYGDGIHDDTKGIQEAIDAVKSKYGFGIVFMPEGSYLITDTIYIPRCIRLIGYGKNRPKIILGDNTPGYDREYPENNEEFFQDRSNAKFMVWFTHKVPSPDRNENWFDIDANPGTFYSGLSNIDFHIGEGNSGAIALRTHYAQNSFIAHCNIEVGSGKAGIYDVGNEMEDVHIFGGKYGIITTRCSPGWPFVMVDTSFTGQAVAAIKTREAGLTIIRTQVKDTPVFITVDEKCFEKLYVEDSILTNISDTALLISCENNSLAQYNVRNVICKNTPVFAKYRESGRVIEGKGATYCVKDFVHGIQIDKLGAAEENKTTVDIVSVDEDGVKPFKSNIPDFPSMDTWVNIKELGAKGDGKTDDTEVIKRAIEQYETIYFPQGWYIVTDTIVLRGNTKFIGMTPIGTQIILPDNTESFAGLGAPKAVIETPVGGTNIINSIGIDSGGRNARAVACKWMSGEASFMNDVKFMGGHGIMEWGNGDFIWPYNSNRTADLVPEKVWDSQYWSLWITNGGGGVFKGIWTASPYASSGLYISDTSTKGCIYAISLEHHVRAEAKFKNVSNWKIFGLQTEEEVAEGPKAQPVELINCSNMLFANLYTFRVVWVNTPFDYCIRTSDCRDIEFLNLYNYSQMKYTINNMLLDVNTNTEVRPWQIARLYITGEAPKAAVIENNGVYKTPAEKICGGFQFVDGGCTDEKGNFYFIDSELKRIYKIDGKTNALTLIMDAPFKPHALACDTEGRLIVVAEYVTPAGATEKGKVLEFERKIEKAGTSFVFFYPANIKLCAYSFEPNNPEETLTTLKKVKRSGVKKPKKVLYPGNRMCDFMPYETVVMLEQEECFMGLDGATIIPVQYDLVRAAFLVAATSGETFYATDEAYKRTYEHITDEDGYIKSFSLVTEQGEFCSIQGKDGNLYVCDGQIQVYNREGVQIGQIQVPERPSTIAFGGENNNTLFVAARDSVYKVGL
jgi:polygalacturonase/sugar lactone lactonase YvrE